MFKSLLIANRGEIALRVMRTAHRLGIRTIAVFSDADQDAPHVARADEAYRIGPAPAADSYLRGEAIIEVALSAGAEAIHPGYGFLSENAGFARACEEAGLVFVGPAPETIEIMGSKSRAKDLMAKAGVPLSPGYQGEDQRPETFLKEAERIGYPVLLKAAAGGGGKGMRIVRGADALPGELESAKREASSAFGDDRFLVEKFIEGPRHVEVQVFGDGKGEVVHLFERDCSVQRRYQKVIEEAPAPKLPGAVRETLLAAGVEAARAVSYRGAGTVEFLYDGAEGVYFMEMNTRLQVEHPVTELVTGQDLVEWQLRVAAGEGLPLRQEEITCTGHAVEARLYAEDASRGYLPSTGRLEVLSFPRGRGIRIDSGVVAGGEVTPFYDPMIAKIIASGTGRRAALTTLAAALGGTRVQGVKANQDFLKAIVTHEAFMEGGVTTRFLDEHGEAVTAIAGPPPEALAMAAIASALSQGRAFRLNAPRRAGLVFEQGGEALPVTMLEEAPGTWSGEAGGESVTLTGLSLDRGRIAALSGAKRLSYKVRPFGGGIELQGRGGTFRLSRRDPLEQAGDGSADAASLLSPMPATVTGVLVEAGQTVEAGTPLVTIEAMKMEHVIKAPAAGTVTELPYAAGDSVAEGAPLVGFEPEEG